MLEAVRTGRPAVVLGPEGSGRTRLTEGVVELLAQEMRAVHLVRGGDAAAGIPLAPIAPLLAEVGLTGTDALGVYSRLPGILSQQRAVLVVDDVAELDRATGVLLGQIVRADVPVVLVGRDVREIIRSVRDELTARSCVSVPLTPLSPDDVLALAASVVGDELSSASAARVIGLGEGSPALVVDLLAASSTTTGPAGVELVEPRPGPRAREVVAQRLAGLSEAARAVLLDVSIAGALPVAVLDDAGLRELRAAGHLETGDAARPARPLDALVLTHALPASELVASRRRLGDLLRSYPAWLPTSTQLLLGGGCTVDPATVARAAEACLADSDADRAAEIVRALPADDDPRTRLLRGRIASARGELDDAADCFTAASGDPALDDAARRQLGQELGLLHAVRRMDPATAVAEVTDVLTHIADADERRVLEADLVKWRLMAGQETPGLAPDPGVTARARLTEAVIAAMIGSMDGTVEQVRSAVADGYACLPDVPDVEPWVPDLLSLSSYLGRAFAGDVLAAEADALARRDAAATSGSPALGMWEYAAAETALHRGEARQMDTLARRAVRHLAWRDFTGLRPTAAALVAVAHARAGRGSAAAQVVGTLTEAQRLDPKVALHVARVEAEALLRSTDSSGAAEVLTQAALTAAGQMHRQLALMALDEAVMIQPTPQRVEQLTELAAVGGPGGLGPLLAARAGALLEGSTDALEPWVDQLLAIGFVGRASHVAGMISRRLGAAGTPDEARVWRQRAVLLGSDHGAARWPVVDGVRALTPRELDVARLAATRSRSREIAERLGLSVRTVDNHLARAYRKLGVTGRDDLREALVLEGELPLAQV